MTVETTGGQGQAPAPQGQQQGQAPAATQDQQGQGQTGQAPATQTPGSAQFDPSTIQDPAARSYLEKLDHELREARTEAARYRTERTGLQQQVQQYQQERETEAERIQREAQEAQQERDQLREQVRQLTVTRAITDAAAEAQAFNPARVAALLDSQVQVDEQGKPTNIGDALAELQRTDPYLFRRAPGGADAGAGAGAGASPTGGSVNDFIRGRVTRGAR